MLLMLRYAYDDFATPPLLDADAVVAAAAIAALRRYEPIQRRYAAQFELRHAEMLLMLAVPCRGCLDADSRRRRCCGAPAMRCYRRVCAIAATAMPPLLILLLPLNRAATTRFDADDAPPCCCHYAPLPPSFAADY